jgi:hypothetical protein
MTSIHKIPIQLAVLALCAWVGLHSLAPHPAWAVDGATTRGEIEGRPAPVGRRQCIGGPDVGTWCNADADCNSSTCQDRNVFNLTISVRFNATAAQLTQINTMMTNASGVLFDATDGQAELGQVTTVNNATGGGDIVISAAGPCKGGGNFCAGSGHWKSGGTVSVGMPGVPGGGAGEALAHELVHLIFDVRDEYQTNGGASGTAQCPSATAVTAGEERCLMDVGGGNAGVPGTEMCWGQGNDTAPLDLTVGNHDPPQTTEQSATRSNRSCWAQVVWSWPTVFTVPAGGPTLAAGAPNAINFVTPSAASRIVLVLDTSGSMGQESPTRLARLQVAAKDFVNLAVNGTELGLVTFSSSAVDQVAIGALVADRSAYINAIDGLTASGATHIGDGLDHARDMITAAGGVTANTSIILMTDGINNRPTGTAAANLQGELDTLLTDSVPVLVTCTGDDLGLDSQCSEIANGTTGFFVDASDAADLPQAFVTLYQRATHGGNVGGQEGVLIGQETYTIQVEAGATQLTAVAQWSHAKTAASIMLTSPDGKEHKESGDLFQGAYLRIAGPAAGTWQVVLTGEQDRRVGYVSAVYLENPLVELTVATRWSTVAPGDPMMIYAAPYSSGPISQEGYKPVATVSLPNGQETRIELSDAGPDSEGHGDDAARDGIYTGSFTDTREKGSYTFVVSAEFQKPVLAGHDHGDHEPVPSEPFVRVASVVVAVADAKDRTERDDPYDDPKGGTDPEEATPSKCGSATTDATASLLFLGGVGWRRRRRI